MEAARRAERDDGIGVIDISEQHSILLQFKNRNIESISEVVFSDVPLSLLSLHTRNFAKILVLSF